MFCNINEALVVQIHFKGSRELLQFTNDFNYNWKTIWKNDYAMEVAINSCNNSRGYVAQNVMLIVCPTMV